MRCHTIPKYTRICTMYVYRVVPTIHSTNIIQWINAQYTTIPRSCNLQKNGKNIAGLTMYNNNADGDHGIFCVMSVSTHTKVSVGIVFGSMESIYAQPNEIYDKTTTHPMNIDSIGHAQN